MRKSADVYRCAATRWMDEGGHAKLLEKCALDLQEALDEIEIIRFWGGDLKAADREIRKRRLLPAIKKPSEEG